MHSRVRHALLRHMWPLAGAVKATSALRVSRRSVTFSSRHGGTCEGTVGSQTRRIGGLGCGEGEGGRGRHQNADIGGEVRGQPLSSSRERTLFAEAERHVDRAMADFEEAEDILDDDGEADAETPKSNSSEWGEDDDTSALVGGGGGGGPLTLPDYVIRRRESLSLAAPEDLVEVATHYLRATVNVKLVSAEDEHAIFPVLLERIAELRVSQLLDIVECHWARSTLVRYGTRFKDTARDRIAELANAAAAHHHHHEQTQAQAQTDARWPIDDEPTGALDPEVEAGGVALEKERLDGSDGRVFAHERVEVEEEERSAGPHDPLLASAAAELDAQTVLRCVVVMGMSAGHRKRDVDFFRVMGAFLAHHINRYKDPNDLVHVLTALARAKIVPSQGFLALLSRRFPVLCKKTPLEPLPCYRAMVNLSRMGHDNMNTYRFLADYMLAHMETKIAEERVAEAKRRAQRESAAPEKADGAMPPNTATTSLGETTTGAGGPDIHAPSQAKAAQAKERLRALTGLSPVMFTRWLLVLARHGAPHQQYLRPLVGPIIVPMLPHLPPPSLTRLLFAMRFFKTADLELIEPTVDLLCTRSGSHHHHPTELHQTSCFIDILTMLSILARTDAAVPSNLGQFLKHCEAVCARGIIATTTTTTGRATDAATASNKNDNNAAGADSNTAAPPPAQLALRPTDMCTVGNYLSQLQRRPEIPLEVLEPLTTLMEAFADRLSYLMQLRVVSLAHVDIFADICAQQQNPDTGGGIERMVKARRAISQSASIPAGEGGEGGDGEDAYYSALDIDVRDTFLKILAVNGTNTYGAYRPLPGPVQLDFRDWLTHVSALDLLEAVDLHEQACPGTLRETPARFLARSVLDKLGEKGEEVINYEAHRLELRPPQDLPLTRADLLRMAHLLQRTPLRQVRESPTTWRFIQRKAQRLNVPLASQVAEAELAAAAPSSV